MGLEHRGLNITLGDLPKSRKPFMTKGKLIEQVNKNFSSSKMLYTIVLKLPMVLKKCWTL
jgi:hypothetical protein